MYQILEMKDIKFRLVQFCSENKWVYNVCCPVEEKKGLVDMRDARYLLEG
jgi:hypothetical protein